MAEQTTKPTLKSWDALAVQLAKQPSATKALYVCRQALRGVNVAGKSVLEVGAGCGLLSAYAVLAGAKRVVALEPQAAGSTNGCAATILRVKERLGAENFTVHSTTVQAFDPGQERFDVLLSYNAVNHLDEPMCLRLPRDKAARSCYRRIFTKMARMTAPGGTLVLADCGRRNVFGDLRVRNPFLPSVDWHKHHSPAVWSELLRSAGFRTERLDWYRPYPLRHLGPLAGNVVANYFLTSHFRLVMQYVKATPREFALTPGQAAR